MAQAGTVWLDVRGDMSNFGRDIADGAKQAGSSLGSALGSGAQTVLGDLGRVAGVAAIGVAGIGAAAVRASTEFNAAMSGVSAVAGASAADMEILREAALKAGADTVFSATEAAAAQGELVKAGVSVSEVLGGALAGSLGLAAAGQLELKDAAEISAQAMNIFGLAGSDVTHIADVLAAGANKSAADVKQLGDALRQGGLVASQLGIGLEDTIGTLSLFADNALIGSDAGTSFKTMLQRFNPASKEAAGEMAKLGLSFYDTEGNFVGLEEAAQRLQDAMSGLTQEQRNASMNQIFGADAIRAANILYEAGADGIREYTDAVNDQGAAQRMAAEQLNNLKGDLEQFSGATETALIRIGDLFDGVLRGAVKSASGLVDVFNDFATTPAWDAIGRNISELAGAGESGLGGLGDKLREQLDSISVADVDRAFAKIEGTFYRFSDAAEGLEPVIAGVGIALGSMALGSLPFIGALVPAISPITGVLGGLVLGSQKGRDALRGLGKEFAELGNTVGVDLLRSLSGFAGELSDGIASAITDVGEAATYAAEVLGPVLGGAIDTLGPPLGDLIEAGGDLAESVFPTIADFAGFVLPAAFDIFGAGVSLAADATGLLADNLWLLVPALAGITAVKFGDQISDWGSKLSGVASQAATSAGDFGTYFKVLREEGGSIGGSLKGAASEVGGLSGSLSGVLNPAILGVTAAVTVGAGVYEAWATAKRRAEKVTRDLADALIEEGDAYSTTLDALRANVEDLGVTDAAARAGLSLRQMSEDLRAAPGEVDKFREQINKSGSDQWLDFGNTFTDNWRQIMASAEQAGIEVPQSIMQIRDAVAEGLISEGEGLELINAMVDADKATELAADNIVNRFADIKDAAADMDIDITPFIESFDAASRAGNFEGQKLALESLTAAYPELAAAAGLAVGDVTSANSGLADETARAVGELQRLADEFEDLAGAPRDVDEASRRAKDSVQAMMEAFAGENFDGFNYANKGIDENTEAGRRNADAIKATVEAHERLAEAQASVDASGKTSTETLQGMADQLGRLRDAGILTQEEYEKLLNLYDLTPEAIATTVVADTAAAKTELDDMKAQLLALPGVTEPERALIEAAPDAVALKNVESSLNLVARTRSALVVPRFEQGAFKGLPTFGIPEFHDGGKVPGAPGAEMLAMLLAGERVLTPTEAQAYDSKVQSGDQFTAADIDRLVAAIQGIDAGARIDVTANSTEGRRIGLDIADELWLRKR